MQLKTDQTEKVGKRVTRENRYTMLFVTKGKKKKFVENKFLPQDEQSLHMKILEANFMWWGKICESKS